MDFLRRLLAKPRERILPSECSENGKSKKYDKTAQDSIQELQTSQGSRAKVDKSVKPVSPESDSTPQKVKMAANRYDLEKARVESTKEPCPFSPRFETKKQAIAEFSEPFLDGVNEKLVEFLSEDDPNARESPLYKFIRAVDEAYIFDKAHTTLEEKTNATEYITNVLLSAHEDIQKKIPDLAEVSAKHVALVLAKDKESMTIQTFIENPNSHAILSSLEPKQAKNLLIIAMNNIRGVSGSNEVSRRSIQMLLQITLKETLSPKEQNYMYRRLVWCFQSKEPELASLFHHELKQANLAVSKETLDEIYTLCLHNIELLKTFVSFFPQPEVKAQDFLNTSIDENNELLAEKIIREFGMEISQARRGEILDQAFDQGNLSMMKMFSPNTWIDAASSKFSIRVDDKDKVLDTLLNFYLNSDLKDFHAVAEFLKQMYPTIKDEIDQVTEFSQKGGSLIARFPSSKLQEEMYHVYGQSKGFKSYPEQQFVYGSKRFEHVQEVMNFIRENPATPLSELYQMLNGTQPWRVDNNFLTLVGERYSRFQELVFPTLKSKASAPGVDFQDKDGFYITESDPEHARTEKLTFITFHMEAMVPAWNHTDFIEGEEWLNRIGISDDFTHLVNAKVDPNSPDDVRVFKEKLAEFYWKGAQLAPTSRGSSQTILELHQMLLMLKGIHPSPPSRKWVLPDCVALSMPKHEFVNSYYSQCWESE